MDRVDQNRWTGQAVAKGLASGCLLQEGRDPFFKLNRSRRPRNWLFADNPSVLLASSILPAMAFQDVVQKALVLRSSF